MTRKTRPTLESGRTLLLVDDNADYLEVTQVLLEREGHTVLTARSGPEALRVVKQQAVDLVLLDYFMPGMTGAEVVAELRRFNPYIQVVLQTGYATERPPRDMLRRLDIQGYYDKSEGPDKLLLWVDVGLKAAFTVQLLYKSRQGLRYILDATPDLHKLQPLQDLMQGILLQVAGLLGAVNSFLAVTVPSGDQTQGFVATMEEDANLVIRAGTGRFTPQLRADECLSGGEIALIGDVLRSGTAHLAEALTVVPLRVGDQTIGVIFIEQPTAQSQDLELLHVFANQAAVAIHNMQLYEMAALDPLTGVYVRRFLEQWLVRELRSAFRSQAPLTLLMLDLDGMKQINDSAGHLAGDQALAAVGKALRQATRDSDIVGRYGGDEFLVILPRTPMAGSQRVADRILNLLGQQGSGGAARPLPLRASLGVSALEPHQFEPDAIPRPVPNEYFQTVAQDLIRRADDGLYQAKRSGGGQMKPGPAGDWREPGAAA